MTNLIYDHLIKSTPSIPLQTPTNFRNIPLVSGSYVRATDIGTRTTLDIDITIDRKSQEIRDSYFKVQDYERRFNQSSSEMFARWKQGLVSGPEYTEWVSAYFDVWDKVNESR